MEKLFLLFRIWEANWVAYWVAILYGIAVC